MFMKIKSEVCGMTKKQKRMLVRIIISFVLFAALMVAEHTGALEGINTWILFVIYLVPYLVIGYDIVYKAVRNISHGQVFDENFLMSIATLGAFAVGDFSEQVIDVYAKRKSLEQISSQTDISLIDASFSGLSYRAVLDTAGIVISYCGKW